MSTQATSLDRALAAALDAERGTAIPGFVKPGRETLGKPPWNQAFFERSRRSLHAMVSGPEDRGVLQVCSAGTDEGRASVAAAMAMALIRTYGERVALLDLDFTRGELSKLFSVAPTPGLADWLEGGDRLRVVVGGTSRLLYLLPAGQHYRDSSLLYREMVRREVVEVFLRHFTWVVMDLPPLLLEPATTHIIPLGTWRVLVGRYRHTLLQDLGEAADLVRHHGTTGFVLTGDDSRVPQWIRRRI